MRQRNSSRRLLLLLLHPVGLTRASQQQCTVCKDGSSVPFPEKPLTVEGIPVDNCGTLESTAGFLSATSDFCGSIQSIGTLCGCEIPESACRLCGGNDSTVPSNFTTQDLVGYNASDFLLGAPDGVPMTCESMEAVLHNYREDETTCLSIRRDVGETCGCPDASGVDSPVLSLSPTTSPPPSVSPREPCRLCVLGGEIQNPDKVLELGDLPIQNCRDLDNFAGLLEANTLECSGMQSLGSLCGCRVAPDACTLCPNGEPIPLPHQRLNWFSTLIANLPESFEAIGNSLTCELMEATLKTPSPDLYNTDPDFACLGGQLKSSICGCSPDWRVKFLTWSYRCSGMLSFLGSMAIIYNILALGRSKRKTVYHQLVLGVSAFDAISSMAYILVGVMAPRDGGFYLSRGNDATCNAQAFMIQLGLTSMFYNLFLSLYFMMVICHNWKEHNFKRLMKYVHLAAVVLGLGLACGALPFYGPQFGTCYVLQPPAADSWWPLIFVYSAPVSIVMVLLTLITARICHRVYRQELASRKWSANQNLALSRRVFWQSFWYMMAFYFATPFLLLSYHWRYGHSSDFAIFILVGLLSPIQGLLNALVYFQRTSKFKDLGRRAQRFSNMVKSLISSHPARSSIDKTSECKTVVSKSITKAVLANKNNEATHVTTTDEGDTKGLFMKNEVSESLSASEQPVDPEAHQPDDDCLPPPPPPPPPTSSPSPILERLRMYQGEDLVESSSEFSDSDDDMFEATRAHWQLNYVDDDDDEDGNSGEEGRRVRSERRMSWLNFRASARTDGTSEGMEEQANSKEGRTERRSSSASRTPSPRWMLGRKRFLGSPRPLSKTIEAPTTAKNNAIKEDHDEENDFVPDDKE